MQTSARLPRRSAQTHGPRLLLFAALAVLSPLAASRALCQAQTEPQASPSPTPTPAGLFEAWRDREAAEAVYYQVQTEALKNRPAAGSFRQAFVENFAIVSSLAAGFFAILTLTVNQAASWRARKDSEFYDALKRFGNQDSPTERATAAAMLVRMSGNYFYTLRRRPDQKWWRLGKRIRFYPYFDTVLSQLINVLQFEEHPEVISSISSGVEQLADKNFERAGAWLYEANVKLQKRLMRSVAELAAVVRVDKADVDLTPEFLNICPLAGYSESVRKNLCISHSQLFKETLDSGRALFDTQSESEKHEVFISAQKQIRDTVSRLSENIHLFEKLFKKREESSDFPKDLDLSGVFLVDADLPGANLKGVNLSWALLRKADLRYAKLQGARLDYAELEGAKMYKAEVSKSTVFDRANWDAADFRMNEWSPEDVDEQLLEDLVERRKLSRTRLPPHPSVEAYLAKSKKSQEARPPGGAA